MVLAHSVKSLIGFCTAANIEAFLKHKDGQNHSLYKIYIAPYIRSLDFFYKAACKLLLHPTPLVV